jgi:hypothetical protein
MNNITNNFSNINYLTGIPLEKAVALFIEQKLGLECSHNNFVSSEYSFDHHNTVDIVISVKGKKIYLELTNPKKTTFLNDAIVDSKIEYFHRQDPEHKGEWVLGISFRNISKESIEKLKKERISVVELCIHAEEENLHATLRALFDSALFKMLKTFSKRYQTDLAKIDAESYLSKMKMLSIISDAKKLYINDGKNPQITCNKKVVPNVEAIGDRRLWQHLSERKRLQVLRRIVFLLKINERSPLKKGTV